MPGPTVLALIRAPYSTSVLTDCREDGGKGKNFIGQKQDRRSIWQISSLPSEKEAIPPSASKKALTRTRAFLVSREETKGNVPIALLPLTSRAYTLLAALIF